MLDVYVCVHSKEAVFVFFYSVLIYEPVWLLVCVSMCVRACVRAYTWFS